MAKTEKVGLLSLPLMVRWFSPTLLFNAAMRAIISPVFGTFADARATQASIDRYSDDALATVAKRYELDPKTCCDANNAVWVDYIADTGDGFDSSYAMASLVAADGLAVMRQGGSQVYDLPAGKVIVFGGDQVYPYPTRDEYKARFEAPYEMAFPAGTTWRQAFVIPGNHDWYDGLNSFDFLFCQARYGTSGGGRIGGIEFGQHRSYFATRLPHNWWIWGADIQFSQYLDVGQVRYFQAVAAVMRNRQPGEPEHKVIICTAEPGWQYEEGPAKSANSNLEIITKILDDAGAKVCAVISGDSHHYCRYYAKDLGLNLITAGGGGAFLHPTHQLRDEVTYDWLGSEHTFTLRCREPVSKGKELEIAAFPSRPTSFWLTWMNLLFPFWNYTFATLLGTLYWVMTWMYAQTPITRRMCLDGVERSPLVEDILVYDWKRCGLAGDTFSAKLQDLIGVTLQAGVHQFLLGVFALLLFMGLFAYADATSRWKRFFMAFFHWLTHISAMIALYYVVNHWGYWTWFGEMTRTAARPFLGPNLADALRTVAYMVQMIFGGGVIAGLVWGGYLFFWCAFFKRHWNDAFSSLRLPDWKNFLRLKLEPDRLTIYPVGLRRSPTRVEWRREKTAAGEKLVPLLGLKPELIDGPIVIDVAHVRMRSGRPPEDRALT